MTFQGAMQKNAELQAIVEKLPKYADTGKPFVPGRDEAWIAVGRTVFRVAHGRVFDPGGWAYSASRSPRAKSYVMSRVVYSTQAAAEAAKEATECPQSNT
ncbi:MAG TPA: hypothetical protein VM487_00745 [Phycisphaerae bacterium]|nr:hypothetical protein [Phycisphaerae bacterium]